jgi:hypothetical protein
MLNQVNYEPRRLNKLASATKKILFLGYSETETTLINYFINNNCEVWHYSGELKAGFEHDLIISFGYKYLIPKEIIESYSAPIINLHMSYLPYNRGAHPNFWSFMDGTPSGVSIHLVDQGVDTGPILYQRYINFPISATTFRDTYFILFAEIEALFIEYIDSIFAGSYEPKKQRYIGTVHKKSDIPKDFLGWDSKITEEVQRLDKLNKAGIDEKLEIINEIENIRKANNINWMDLLRLAFKISPNEAKILVRRINNDDMKISDLFKRLGG